LAAEPRPPAASLRDGRATAHLPPDGCSRRPWRAGGRMRRAEIPSSSSSGQGGVACADVPRVARPAARRRRDEVPAARRRAIEGRGPGGAEAVAMASAGKGSTNGGDGARSLGPAAKGHGVGPSLAGGGSRSHQIWRIRRCPPFSRASCRRPAGGFPSSSDGKRDGGMFPRDRCGWSREATNDTFALHGWRHVYVLK
jgi:hypothetical protein